MLYQSLRGGTARAAAAIAQAAADKGAVAGAYPVTSFDAQFVLTADLVVIGTWTDGLFGLGARPGQIGKLNALPSIAHRTTALFVTYEISPAKSLAGLREWAEERQAVVVAEAGFKVRGPFRRDIGDEIDSFVEQAMAAVSAGV